MTHNQYAAERVAAPIGLRESLFSRDNPGRGGKQHPTSRQWVSWPGGKHASLAIPLIMLAACTSMPDRADCTDRLRDWRDGCAAARDDAVRTAPEPPAEEPETGGGIGTPDGGEGETPGEPAKEPDRETDPDGWRDWKDGRSEDSA